MKNKKEFLGILISVLICVFVFAAIVYATTTIGNDITIGGNINFSGYVSAPGALTAAVGVAGVAKYCETDYPCTYYVTFVSDQGETQGGTESNGIVTDNVKINLSDIPIGPTGTTARKIYRSFRAYSYLIATIDDNITTTYTDDVVYATWLAGTNMPMGSTTSGTIYSGTTAALKIDQSGNIAIGSAKAGGTLGSPAFFSLGKTFTENAPLAGGNPKGYYGQSSAITVQPSGESAYGYYYGNNTTITLPSSNAQEIGGIQGNSINVMMYGSGNVGALNGEVVTVYNQAPATDVKGMWSYGFNQDTVSGFFYGIQASVDNRSYDVGVGNIGLARAGRFRLDNYTNDSWGGIPSGPANMTTAQVVFANLSNSTSGVVGSTIGTAAGFWYDLSNDTGSTITNSYGLYLSAPINTGTINNHYGLYLGDQTVAGTTNNFSIYSAGGTNYFAGSVGIGDTTPAYKLSIDGTASVSGTTYLGDAYFSGVVSASSSGIRLDDGVMITTGVVSPSGDCGTSGSLFIDKTNAGLYMCGIDSAWNVK